MRFQINQQIPFIRIRFKARYARFFGDLYCPWVDNLESIELVLLICVEHHKVACDQDPHGEKKYDGYVFKDANGLIYHNQYPRASYGQMDDRNDRRAKRRSDNDDDWYPFTLVSDYLERVSKGVTDVAKESAEHSQQLHNHYNDVVDLVAKELRLKVNRTPYEFRRTDDGPTTTIDGMYTITFEPIQQENTHGG